MAYSDFTLPKIVKEFQLALHERSDLFAQVAEVTLSDYPSMTLSPPLYRKRGKGYGATIGLWNWGVYCRRLFYVHRASKCCPESSAF